MRFTLTAAAKEAGVSKGTISKALKSGRLSGERQEDGSFQIDASELFRVFPRKPEQPVSATDEKPKETASNPAETGGELQVLRVTVQQLEGRLSEQREAMEREREAWDRERMTVKLIEDQLGRERTVADDLRRLLDEERAERRALQLRLTPPEAPTEPDRSHEVEALRKRVEETEDRMVAAVEALERAQERAVEMAGTETPPRVRTGFLGRLFGR